MEYKAKNKTRSPVLYPDCRARNSFIWNRARDVKGISGNVLLESWKYQCGYSTITPVTEIGVYTFD